MAKKKKHAKANPGSGGKRKFFQGATKTETETKSAFESVSVRKKFDILGRKVKGERGNVIKARTEAIEKRRRTLLREHEENGKANSFVDRRFGENDDGLSAEDKHIGRLAKARLRQYKKSKNFSLNDDDEDGFGTLTHLGQPLAEGDLTAKPNGDDDDDDNLDGEMTRAFHFGGGDFEPTLKRDGDGHDVSEPERRKTKKEVMEELIAKSKFHKAEKQKQREDDQYTLDKLDADFKVISQGGMLSSALRKAVGHMKPTTKAKSNAPEQEKDEYDTWARTLAYERRGQAGERARTQEEVEAQEKLALEQAERKRLKRMRGVNSDDESSDDDGPQGGYAARRRKAKKAERGDDDDVATDDVRREGGDDLDENFALDSAEEVEDEEEDGVGSEDEDDVSDEDEADDDMDDNARLRKSFRSELKDVEEDLDKGKNRLRKLGILQDGVEAKDSEEDEEDYEDEDEDDKDTEDEDEDDEDAEDEDDVVENDHAGVLRELEEEIAGNAASREGKNPDKKETPRHEAKSSESMRVDIPFTFPMPESYEDLAGMLGAHGAEDTFTIISRIRACNAPTLAAENRKRIQTLFGLLLQRFEIFAGQAPIPTDHLDVLSTHIVDLSAQVPFFAATAVKARVEKMSSRLRQALRSGETGWPPSRTVLLLSLFAAIFPTTDKVHPVMSPVSLYLGNLLAHCAIRSSKDAALAVIIATMSSMYSSASERVFPEAVALMSALVLSASRPKAHWSDGLPTHLAEQIGGPWLSSAINSSKSGTLSLPETLNGIYSGKVSDELLAVVTLRAALSCLRQLSRPVAKTASASEILLPVRSSVVTLLKALKNAKSPSAKLCEDFMKELDDSLSGSVKTPLAYHTKAAEAIKTYNPMYEEDGYQKGRDYDPNRERAEARKLKKQLKQEARGAMRELRKDNRFMADARAKEQAQSAEERGARQRDVLSFLEKQESDFKSGGQGGQIVKNKRRVSKGSRRAF